MKALFKTMAVTSVMLTALFGTVSCEKDDSLAATTKTNTNLAKQNGTFVQGMAEDSLLYNSSAKYLQPLQGRKLQGNSDIIYKIVKWGLEKGAGYIGGKIGTEVFHDFVQDTHAENMQEMNEINGKLDTIDDLLKDLQQKLTDDETAAILRDHLDYNDKLGYMTVAKLKAISENEGDEKRLLYEWAEAPVNKNRAYLSTLNYLNFLSSNINSQHKTMPQLYNDWISRTIPWDKGGSDAYNNMMVEDVSIATSAYLMSLTYCVLEEENSTAAALTKAYSRFAEVYQVKN